MEEQARGDQPTETLDGVGSCPSAPSLGLRRVNSMCASAHCSRPSALEVSRRCALDRVASASAPAMAFALV